MAVTGKPESEVTVESVEAELKELDEYHKGRRRKLRALLGVLEQEAGGKEETDADH